jgi:hypothetical protein
MVIDRNTPAIIADGYRFVGVNRDNNFAAVTSQGFVDRVVDNLKNHMVKAGSVIRVTDVHTWPLAHGFEAF